MSSVRMYKGAEDIGSRQLVDALLRSLSAVRAVNKWFVHFGNTEWIRSIAYGIVTGIHIQFQADSPAGLFAEVMGCCSECARDLVPTDFGIVPAAKPPEEAM